MMITAARRPSTSPQLSLINKIIIHCFLCQLIIDQLGPGPKYLQSDSSLPGTRLGSKDPCISAYNEQSLLRAEWSEGLEI